jgi:predicted nucleic acid-binding protein
MSVLVDSSVWIDYFRGLGNTHILNFLIDENLLVTNELILAELIPYLKLRKQRKVISLLNQIEKCSLKINWKDIIDLQVKCLQKGVNKVGIPDIIIAQNAIQNHLSLYTSDKHFKLMSEHIPLLLY